MTRTTWLWTCEECGVEFTTNYHRNDRLRRFCSRSCKARWTFSRCDNHSEQVLRKRAVTNQIRARLNTAESRVYNWLQSYAGLQIVPQCAVSKYNIDLALPQIGIAIELDGNHPSRRPGEEGRQDIRANVLEAHGWVVLHFVNRKGSPGEIKRIRRVLEPLITEYLEPNLELELAA